MDEFELNDEFLQRFMDENDYEWELGVISHRVERPVYYDYYGLSDIFAAIWQTYRDEWTIVCYQYVLKIKCKK